jgi:H+-transporting ATPase
MIVMLALLNDGAILSIAYDNVHYKVQPEAWNMRMVLGICTVLGVIGVVAALSWRARLSSRSCAHPDTDVFETVRSGASANLPDAHARPFLVHTPRAGSIDGGARHANRGDVDRGVWRVHDALGWGWALFVWGYALAWFLVNDRVKLLAYRICDAIEAAALAKRPIDLKPQIAHGPMRFTNSEAAAGRSVRARLA